jgi:hypothetical protein
MVGYEPPERDGRFHHLRVELNGTDRKELKVKTRPGYMAAEK